MLTLGLDASTQSCSAVIVDAEDGSIVTEASVNYGERLPGYNAPNGYIPDGPGGEVHSDPRMWLDALELLLADLAERCNLSRIRAISGAGQQHASVYLGEAWPDVLASLNRKTSLAEQLAPTLTRPTSPIWMDGSTGPECREIAQAVGGEAKVCAISGSVPIERFTGPQIRRFAKQSPDAYARTTRIHLVSSFLCSVLCGGDAPIDTGDGAGMNLADIHRWDWSDALLEATAANLRAKLPRLVPGATTAGKLAPYFEEKFGLTAGIPVTVFTGDNPSSLVGMGAGRPGKVVVSLGTSDTFFAAMPKVVADPEGYGHAFGNPVGGAMSLQCFINGSLVREAIKDKFGYDWDQFTRAIESTPPGNDGRLMVPFFRPEISPRIDCSEPILRGDEPFRRWKAPDAAIRACVEGQFLNMKLRSAWMHLNPEVIYLTGGASRNDAVAQVAADIFQAQVQRLAVSGSVALGAALRCAENELGCDLEALVGSFCQPETGSTVVPQASGTVYEDAAERFAQLLAESAP